MINIYPQRSINPNIPKLKQIVYRSYECTKENKNQIEYDHVEIEISDPTSEQILAYLKHKNSNWVI